MSRKHRLRISVFQFPESFAARSPNLVDICGYGNYFERQLSFFRA